MFIAELQPPHLADPAVDLADAVQGRDRSSSSELQTLDSIDARFQISQDTLSRRRLAIHLSKSFRFLSTPDPLSPDGEGMRQFSTFRCFRFGGA